jgi:hypothetical protein
VRFTEPPSSWKTSSGRSVSSQRHTDTKQELQARRGSPAVRPPFVDQAQRAAVAANDLKEIDLKSDSALQFCKNFLVVPQVKSSGTRIAKLDHNIVRSHIDCSYPYI